MAGLIKTTKEITSLSLLDWEVWPRCRCQDEHPDRLSWQELNGGEGCDILQIFSDETRR